jgi:glycerol-3-phosphate acyltransferase PlsX
MSDIPARTIAVDAMGGDRGPAAVVEGVRLALREPENAGLGIVLIGQKEVLDPLLAKARLANEPRLSVLHASEVIGMDEKPIKSIKQKRDSSLVRAVELVKEGRCSAAVSCGNTGSLMACGTLKLRMMPGVERPALASVWPSREQHFVMLDVGANPSTKPDHFVHNAVMGSHFCRLTLGREKPRVGLLSIGTEESKGHELIQAANERLRAIGDLINYTGPIEGFDIFENKVDVVVCDGFTGNVLLKTSESLYKTFRSVIKDKIIHNPIRILGALLIYGAFKDMKRDMDPDRYSGAPLLGLQGNVIKAHGSSSSKAICSAIRVAREFVDYDMTTHAADDIAKANAILAKLKAPDKPSEPVAE